MFDASEVLRGDRVALVTEAAAKLWPAGENPIGARVQLGPARAAAGERAGRRRARAPKSRSSASSPTRGTPASARTRSPSLILPYTVVAPAQRQLAVRTAGDPNQLLNPLRAQVREIDPEQPLGRPITLAEIFGQEVVQPRFTMALFSAFAAARPGARRRGHLQRAVVPRHAADARARRAHGARRVAPLAC